MKDENRLATSLADVRWDFQRLFDNFVVAADEIQNILVSPQCWDWNFFLLLCIFPIPFCSSFHLVENNNVSSLKSRAESFSAYHIVHIISTLDNLSSYIPYSLNLSLARHHHDIKSSRNWVEERDETRHEIGKLCKMSREKCSTNTSCYDKCKRLST